ncbi:MAG: hypothetical protein ACI351_06250 [Candidatus Avelusimicrobium sp.]|uniref:hypothetical protein n=1 Tax=Candidatus Avelusimicrobium sp. TaxID=3048833 RepID=UPI003F0A1A1F
MILRQEDFSRAPSAETIQFHLFLEPHTGAESFWITKGTIDLQKQSFEGAKQTA